MSTPMDHSRALLAELMQAPPKSDALKAKQARLLAKLMERAQSASSDSSTNSPLGEPSTPDTNAPEAP